jgi:hypothetical protein
MSTTARRLLVATPMLLDPNFFRTVVFMIEHTDEAALGVVINRPSDASSKAVPDCALAADPLRSSAVPCNLTKRSSDSDGLAPMANCRGLVSAARTGRHRGPRTRPPRCV